MKKPILKKFSPTFSLYRQDQQGQSLLEVLVAVAIAALVLVALVQVVTSSVRNANFARNRARATQYAQESIEEARQLRDENPSDFFTNNFINSNCGSPVSPLVDYPGGGFFTRERRCDLAQPLQDEVAVEVIVSWAEGGRSHQSALETNLTDWR